MLCWFFIVKTAISKVLGHLCQLYVRGILLLLAIAAVVATSQIQGFSMCPSKSQELFFYLSFLNENFPLRLRRLSILPVSKGREKVG